MRRTVSRVINEAARVATPVTFRSKEEMNELLAQVGPTGLPAYRRWQMRQIKRRIKQDFYAVPRKHRQEFIAMLQDQTDDLMRQRREEMEAARERLKPPADPRTQAQKTSTTHGHSTAPPADPRTQAQKTIDRITARQREQSETESSEVLRARRRRNAAEEAGDE